MQAGRLSVFIEGMAVAVVDVEAVVEEERWRLWFFFWGVLVVRFRKLFIEWRLVGRIGSHDRTMLRSRLSVLPCMLRGGVKGEFLGGRSVGRRTAGMKSGDLRFLGLRGSVGKMISLLLGEGAEAWKGVEAVVGVGEK